jgi:hypothetical protein
MTCSNVFKVSQLPHDVRCRWKGLVKSFLTMHKIYTLWTFTKRHQTSTELSTNVYKTFIKRCQSKRFQNVLNQNVFKTFSIKTLSKHSQNVHYTLAFPLWFRPLVIPVWTVYFIVYFLNGRRKTQILMGQRHHFILWNWCNRTYLNSIYQIPEKILFSFSRQAMRWAYMR